jgi:hypothetical protein
MNPTRSAEQNRSFATLRQLIRARSSVERCDLCSVELTADHQHLIEVASRKLICACQACAILFSDQGDRKYRRVPQRYRRLADFHLSDAQWDSLLIPINLAFFFHSTTVDKVVTFYPSPAGAMESLLALESWEEIVLANPILKEMEPDVEALLVKRISQASEPGAAEYYLVPIDECYKLVGLIRLQWRGLSGGKEVWEEIERFFAALKNRSNPTRDEARA